MPVCSRPVLALAPLFVAGLALAIAPPPAPAPGAAKPPAPPAAPGGARQPDANSELIKMVEAQSAVAPEHKSLEPLVGSFKIETNLYLNPKGKPLTISGTTTNTWILGNRFVQMDSHSDAKSPLKFDALTVYGFDTRHKKFTVWGVDTTGTYGVSAEGTFDKDSRTFKFTGENDEPEVGKIPFVWTLKVDSNDKHTMTIELAMAGMEKIKILESTCTRVPK